MKSYTNIYKLKLSLIVHNKKTFSITLGISNLTMTIHSHLKHLIAQVMLVGAVSTLSLETTFLVMISRINANQITSTQFLTSCRNA